MDPLVSIIVLNWQGLNYLERCVKSCLAQDYANIEIIVVDNASTDGSFQKFRTRYPDLRYIRNESNIGYGRGMNRGLAASSGDFVVPLNMDAFLEPDVVRRLLDPMLASPNLGATSPKVIVTREDSRSDEAQMPQSETGLMLRKQLRGASANLNGSKDPHYVFGPSGSCPFLRRAMLEEIALFPGEYFDGDLFYGREDLDLYFRMQLQGWKCLYVSEAIVSHVGSGSLGGKQRLTEKPLRFQRLALRSRYYIMISDLPKQVLIRILPHLFITELGSLVYFLVKSPTTLIAVLFAWYDTITRLPKLVRKRRNVLADRKVNDTYLMRFFEDNLRD